MSNFTDACAKQAISAWHAFSVVNTAPITQPAQSKRQRPARERVQLGSLYFVNAEVICLVGDIRMPPK
jgi:hypothetical protein